MRAAWNRRLSDVAVLAFIGFVLTACNAPMPPRPEIAPRPGAGDYGPGSPFGPFVFRVGQGTATLKLDAPLRTPAGMGYFTLEINFTCRGRRTLSSPGLGTRVCPSRSRGSMARAIQLREKTSAPTCSAWRAARPGVRCGRPIAPRPMLCSTIMSRYFGSPETPVTRAKLPTRRTTAPISTPPSSCPTTVSVRAASWWHRRAATTPEISAANPEFRCAARRS